MASSDSYIGSVVAKRFHLKRLLGKGAMGSVYYAEDIVEKNKFYAIKFLSPTLVNNNLKQRFAREAGIGAKLGKKSNYIVRVLAYGVHEETVPFYVMEYVQGKSLQLILKEQHLLIPEFFEIARQICMGLEVAHQGIEIKNQVFPVIHRDLKPANILVTSHPKLGKVVKILDFGIAKLLADGAGLTQVGDFLGTLAYCSPEQMEGRSLDNRSDIYSLGVIFFKMLTGKAPWESPKSSYGDWYKIHHTELPRSFKTVSPELEFPEELETFVVKCLAKKPRDRPATVSEILNTLDNIEKAWKPNLSTFKQPESVIPTSLTAAEILPQADAACWQASWPKKKPIAEIVFSHPVRTEKETLAALWVMLPQAQIDKIKNDLATPHNVRFFDSMSPHPMLLWMTILYSPQHEPKCLPSFLDLKTKSGQSMARLLAATGMFRVLFFPIEQPEKCDHVMTFLIAPDIWDLLKQWCDMAETIEPSGTAKESREKLRAEFQKNKHTLLLVLAKELSEVLKDPVIPIEERVSEDRFSLIQKISKKLLDNFRE